MPYDRRCLLGCPPGTTLHKFPDDEKKREKWLQIIDMQNCPKKNLYLCTRHFERRMKGKTRVVWNALPTLHLQGINDEHFQEVAEENYDESTQLFQEENDSCLEETTEETSSYMNTRQRSAISKHKAKIANVKLTPAQVVKHKIKIVDGRAYKLPEPVNETDAIAAIPTQLIAANYDNSSDKPILTNARNNLTSMDTAYEVVDDIEALEKDVNEIIMEEFTALDELQAESAHTSEDNEEHIRNAIIQDLKGVDEEIFDENQENEELTLPLEEQKIKFGMRGRHKKEKCGYVERFPNNNTFCLTCSDCNTEFELWDWQQFIDHINEYHTSLKIQKPRKPPQASSSSSNQNEEHQLLIPKVEQTRDNDLVVDDVVEDGNLQNNSKPNLTHATDDDSLDNSLTNDQDEDDNQLYDDDDEDWQVDKLEEYDNIEIYEEQMENNGDSNSMHDNDVENSTTIQDEQQQKNYENEYGEYEADFDADADELNDSVNLSPAVINFRSTEHARILKFLKTLRTFPVLWYPRRYGPPVYDQELKEFLKLFDETMTTREFRSSVEHLRHQYKRFTPLTPRLRVKLQNDADLRECIQIIKEIADKLSKPFAFYCDVCNFCFLDEQRMKTHRFLKHKLGNLPFICSCGNRFEYELQKDEHENLHKLRPRFTCEMCGSNFIFNRQLRDHMNEAHPETQENPLPFPCTKCGKKFPSIAKRSQHMERHAEPKYVCKICNQSYKTGFRLRHHLKRHEDQRDWVCEHCGKAFIEKRSLNAHLFRVHKDGGIKCVHCRTFFAGKESFDAHNRKFHPNGTNLDRMAHMRSYHNSIYKSRHLGDESSSANKRQWQCKECGEIFQKMWSLVAHKRQTGHNLQMFNCTHCEAVLSSGKTLKGHMRRVHKLPIATLADLRNLLVANEEAALMESNETHEVDVEEGLKIEEIEIFETYDIEEPQYILN